MIAQLKNSMMVLTIVAAGTMTANADHLNGRMIGLSENLVATACELDETVNVLNMPCFVERRTELLHRRAIRINERLLNGDSLYAVRGDLIGFNALLPSTERWVERYSRVATCHSRALMTELCDQGKRLELLVEEAIRCQRASRRRPVITPPCETVICPTTGRNVLPPPTRYYNHLPHGFNPRSNVTPRGTITPHVTPRDLAPPAPRPTWYNNGWQTRNDSRSPISSELLLSFLINSLNR